MAKHPLHFDHLLRDWPFNPGKLSVREVQGNDGRLLLQMRVDMGILQLETTGRPDGMRPEGFETYYDLLLNQSFVHGPKFRLTRQQCAEVDREFYQFYHRRICWLSLNRYPEAVRDADHTLAFMDFCTAFSPSRQWTLLHEQYRPFVMFHRVQALALTELEDSRPQDAVEAIKHGMEALEKMFADHEDLEHLQDAEFLEKLGEMKDAIAEQYDLEPSLAEQLAQAVAQEQYELAARLRDKINQDSR